MRYFAVLLIGVAVLAAANAGAQEDADPHEIAGEVVRGTLGLLIGTQNAPVKVRVTRCWNPPNVWRTCRVVAVGTSTCRMVLDIRRAGRNFHGTARRMTCSS